MSVSLVITWSDGSVAEVPIAGQRGFLQDWRPLALELGLSWVPEFAYGINVSEQNLDSLLLEMVAFRDAAAARGVDYEDVCRTSQCLVGALQKLIHSRGWSAMFG